LSELGDEFGFLKAGLADTGFAIGVLFGAMLYGASEQEIDKLERGLSTPTHYGGGSERVAASRRCETN
jgi:hypothetical protein